MKLLTDGKTPVFGPSRLEPLVRRIAVWLTLKKIQEKTWDSQDLQ
jgi:hypothetical protein